ncbi:MAG: hypothetical protein ACPGD8_00175 [Flavobacteriales bacterium]
MRFLLLLSIAIFLAGCSAPKSDLIQTVIGSENAHFRGVSIGDKKQKVLKKTAANLVTDNEAGVATAFDANGVSVTVQYEFEDLQLYSIQADLFFADTSALNTFEHSLIEQYNSKYGELTEKGGFFVWRENNQIEFNLADESIEFGQPKLSLTIYNFSF